MAVEGDYPQGQCLIFKVIHNMMWLHMINATKSGVLKGKDTHNSLAGYEIEKVLIILDETGFFDSFR